MTASTRYWRALILSAVVVLSVVAGAGAFAGPAAARHLGFTDTVHEGGTVFQGETGVDFDETDFGQTTVLQKVGGDAEGTDLVEGSVPRDQPTGRYSIDGTTDTASVVVETPRISAVAVDVFSGGSDTGRDVEGDRVSTANASDLRVRADFNFAVAESIAVTVTGPDGVDVTEQVVNPDVGDGDARIEQSGAAVGIDLSAADVGTYTITAEGVGDFTVGPASRTTTVSLVPAAPVARCTIPTTEVVPGEQVVIDASNSTADLVSFDVDGDGTVELTGTRDLRQSVQYEASGSYTPVINAERGQQRDTATCPTVTVNRPPTVALTYSPQPAIEGEQTTLDATDSTDPDGRIVEYRWDLNGDGTIDRVTSAPKVTYTYGGSTDVELVVVDDDGTTSRSRRTIRVTAPPSIPWAAVIAGGIVAVLGLWFREPLLGILTQAVERVRSKRHAPPNAKVVYLPEEPAPRRPVLFDGSLSFDPDDRIVSYRWTIDDRTPTGQRFVHAFAVANDYEVELAVTNSRGETGTSTETVTVEAGGSDLVLARVHPDAPGGERRHLDREYLVFENVGNEGLELGGWTVHETDEDGARIGKGEHAFTFDDGFELEPGTTVTVHTGAAPDSDVEGSETTEGRHCFWNAPRSVWDDETDVVVVTDDDEVPVLAMRYERTAADEYALEPLDVGRLVDWFPPPG